MEVSRIALFYDESVPGDIWELTEDVTVTDFHGSFTIPAGMRTDLASIPWWLTWLFPRYGKHLRAAVVHDYLYRKRGIIRARADAIFLQLMKHYDVPRWRQYSMYYAVRVFGGGPYKKASKVF